VEPTDLIGLGDHPALDFVNSTTTQGAIHVELLGDGSSYLTWLELAGLISPAERSTVEERFNSAELDDVAAQAREVREWLRPVIATWATSGGDGPPAATLKRLNEILEPDRRYLQLEHDETVVLSLEDHRHWLEARQLLVPPVVAAAALLADGDHQLVRHCEGVACTMWFYDRTKAHRRRWCSMALCGNRAKARNHRQRHTG
jgi:predicted RNA-binding Zn ribbon-like protein